MATSLVSSRTAWFHRFLIALVLGSLVMLTAVGGGYWYLNAKWANANDIDLQLDGGPTANFLILGSDSRAFVASEEDAASFGEVGGERADTLIVVRIDPDSRKALLVSFPRDLWVEDPGGGSEKINASFADGPQGVVDTIRHNFNIPIHHYVQVDFAGFRNIVGSMGGVEMYVAAPARDAKTGLNIPTAGCVTLDGAQALAWVRSRHYQYYESGTWRSDPTGDFGRINRQQDFIRRLIAQALESGASNPLRGDDLIDSGLDNITVDSDLGVGDVLKLVRVFRSGDPGDVEMLTVPADVGRRGGQSVVIAREAEAVQLFDRLRGEGPFEGDVAPANVTVRVLNGVGSPGLATRTSRQLAEQGFLPGGSGDAERFGYTTTQIHYAEGAQEKAELVQAYLGGVGELVEDRSVRDVDVVVVVGEDFTAVTPPAGDALGGTELSMLRASTVHAQGETPEPAGTGPSPEC